MSVKTSEINIVIRMKDKATAILRKNSREIRLYAKKAVRAFRSIKTAIFSVKGAILSFGLALGAGGLAKSFVRAAADTENMRLTLQSLLGTVEDANILFDDLATFAAKVPFELEEIMRTATMLSGV
ncbi:MAG: hypothetical protein U9Q07_05575, partial [Planctomycetota bacterium]|nr:hypothetical protein [Planctomycetota bacterium]